MALFKVFYLNLKLDINVLMYLNLHTVDLGDMFLYV